jgi:hypothetical protein
LNTDAERADQRVDEDEDEVEQRVGGPERYCADAVGVLQGSDLSRLLVRRIQDEEGRVYGLCKAEVLCMLEKRVW